MHINYIGKKKKLKKNLKLEIIVYQSQIKKKSLNLYFEAELTI